MLLKRLGILLLGAYLGFFSGIYPIIITALIIGSLVGYLLRDEAWLIGFLAKFYLLLGIYWGMLKSMGLQLFAIVLPQEALTIYALNVLAFTIGFYIFYYASKALNRLSELWDNIATHAV